MACVHANRIWDCPRAEGIGRASRWAFFGAAALFFVVTTTATIAWCTAMAGMGMPMPGGWTLSMMWMPMCGQDWPGVAASFLAMWGVMMAAMMLPSLLPALRHCREAAGWNSGLLVALGYFAVWTALGAAIFPAGALLAQAALRLPALAAAMPVAAGAVVAIAGALQFSAWKARHLAFCRTMPLQGDKRPATAGAAWQHGLRLGLHCCQSCAGFTAILLATGMMELSGMVVVGAAITAERLAPAGERVSHAIGIVAIAAGALMLLGSMGR